MEISSCGSVDLIVNFIKCKGECNSFIGNLIGTPNLMVATMSTFPLCYGSSLLSKRNLRIRLTFSGLMLVKMVNLVILDAEMLRAVGSIIFLVAFHFPWSSSVQYSCALQVLWKIWCN